MEVAVARHRPELIVCPMLKTFIPESIWRHHRCLVVHPGPKGDRGPSSLDWAIELGMAEWGVTVLEADAEADGGDIWADADVPHTRRRQEQPVPPRGPHAPRSTPSSRRSPPSPAADGRAGAARLRRPARDRPAAPAAAASRSRDRLGRRLDRHRDPPHPRRRGPSRACSTRSRAASSTCSAPIARARCAASRARSSPSAPARSAAPPSTAPSGSRTSRRPAAHFKLPGRARLLALDVPELPVADPRAAVRAAHVPRDLLRRAPRRRLPALRLLQRRDEHRASAAGCSTPTATHAAAKTKVIVLMGGSTSSPTAST